MDYLERDHAQHGEFYALVLMGTVGMCFMASSTDLHHDFPGAGDFFHLHLHSGRLPAG